MNLFMILVLLITGFLFGVVIGYVISICLKAGEESIGDLRIDESDPEDGPYLFLELKSKPDDLKLRKRVTLNVRTENYISQK